MAIRNLVPPVIVLAWMSASSFSWPIWLALSAIAFAFWAFLTTSAKLGSAFAA